MERVCDLQHWSSLYILDIHPGVPFHSIFYPQFVKRREKFCYYGAELPGCRVSVVFTLDIAGQLCSCVETVLVN